MITKSVKPIPEPLRYGTISVDGYDDKVPVGRLWYAHFAQEKPFRGLMQLLLLTDGAMQEMDYPATYMQPRRFSPAKDTPVRESAATAGEKSVPGRLATFRIKVMFRQNAGWQGTLAWVEGGQEQAFRSVLEMAMLLDSALDNTVKTV